MQCPRDGDPSVVHAWGARAIVYPLIAIGSALMALAGCMPSATGVTLQHVPGQAPGKLVDLDRVGKVPAGTPMCMPEETGCIETGWGPAWDIEKGREGAVRLRHAKHDRKSAELGLRARERERDHQLSAQQSGECTVYWEQDEDLGSAPVGECR